MAPSVRFELVNRYQRQQEEQIDDSISLAQLSASLDELEEKRRDIVKQRKAAALNNNDRDLIAIVLCIRSNDSWTDVRSTLLHSVLLPSIENSITEQEHQLYQVEMVICFDTNDEFFENPDHLETFQKSTYIPLNFLSIPKKPNRPHYIPFNECTKAAYEYNAQYIVRINDDTEFTTHSWITLATSTLASFTPPNVGVTGPSCFENNKILTHDMVHRTHLDIFGPYYYPDVFDNYWIDDWITKVYSKENRSKRIDEWIVKHHLHHYGTRYEFNYELEQKLEEEVKKGMERIEGYLKFRWGEDEMVLGNTDRVKNVWGPMALRHERYQSKHKKMKKMGFRTA